MKPIARDLLEVRELDQAIIRIAERFDTPGDGLRLMLFAGGVGAVLPFVARWLQWLVGWPV